MWNNIQHKKCFIFWEFVYIVTAVYQNMLTHKVSSIHNNCFKSLSSAENEPRSQLSLKAKRWNVSDLFTLCRAVQKGKIADHLRRNRSRCVWRLPLLLARHFIDYPLELACLASWMIDYHTHQPTTANRQVFLNDNDVLRISK